LPAGEPVTVVCFAMNSQGIMHKFIQTINAVSGENIVNVTLTPVSEDGLLTSLNDL
jgi:hypothetical protein